MSNTRQKIQVWIQNLTPDLGLLLVLSLLLTGHRVLSQPWYLPTDGADSVFIENTSRQNQRVWISPPVDSENSNPELANPEELAIELTPLETKEISLMSYKKFPWIQIKSYENVPLRISLLSGGKKNYIPFGRSDYLKSKSFLKKQSGLLYISNLSILHQNQISIHASPQGSTGSPDFQIELSKFESVKIPISISVWDQIQIHAEYPVTAYFISDDGLSPLLPQKSKTIFTTEENTVYFNMSNQDHTQSFVFKTKDPQLIANARKQIENPDLRMILFAKIEKGPQNFNRDLSDPLSPVWSWSVSEIHGFGFFGSLDCDGSPQILEDYLLPWLNAETGICFWNYRIEREVTPTEIQTGMMP